MKRIISISIIIILCISLAACSTVSVDVAKIDKEETYPNGTGSLEKVFTSFEEITNIAEYVIEVDVQDNELELLDDTPITHSKVKILDVQKGDLNVDDVIEIVELGGVTKDKGEAIAGVPVLKKGQKLVLFLKKYKDAYCIVGAFQGKFIEREGFVFQQATEDVKLKDYQPKEVKDFKGQVKESIEKLKKDKSDK